MDNVFCIVSLTGRISQPTQRKTLREPLVYNNMKAHCLRFHALNDNGSPADLTGVGVTGDFTVSGHNSILPILGTVNGNTAELILPAPCYAYAGRYTAHMNLTKNGQTRTAMTVDGFVERNTTDAIVDPGTPVSNIETAINGANAAAAAANASVAQANAALETATQAAARANAVADQVGAKVGEIAKNTQDVADLKSAIDISNIEVFGGVGEGFPVQFENGTYEFTASGKSLIKYYGGGYDLTRKVVKSTTFTPPCSVELKAKSGYSFTVFLATNGVITSDTGMITEYVLNPGQQYGITLRATNGTDDISALSVDQIIEIVYESSIDALDNKIENNEELVNGVIQKEKIWDGSVEEADTTRVTGYQINGNGNLIEKAAFSYVWFVAPESATYKISVTTSQTVVYVYNSNDFKRSTLVTKFYPNAEVYVEQGKYIAVSMWSLTAIPTVAYSTNSSITLKDTVALSKAMKGEVNGVVDLALDDGYLVFSPDDFERGSYISFTSKDSRTYRARCKTPITFERPAKLVADSGFYLYAMIQGYSSQGDTPVLNIPANAPFVLYIRRIYEDTSEVIDVPTFVSKVHISTALAPIELYAPWFTDITMFPRIGISGDSYSAGGGIISGVRDLTWGKNLERESGVTVDIYAKSGESIQQWTSDETNGLPALLAGEECGLYWFAHGINGTSSAASIGTPDDMSANPKPNTFYGQYVYAIQTIQRVFPRARIVVATIVGTGYSLYQTTYAAVNTAIRNIAEYCGVPLVDLADDDFYKSNWYDKHHLSNHPTAMLNAGIAHANRRLFAKCVMDNPNYFIDYGNKYKTAISCPPVAGGFITASPSVAANGATVTLSNTPYPGYHFVRYESSDVSITDGTFVVPGDTGSPGNGTYTITGVFETD